MRHGCFPPCLSFIMVETLMLIIDQNDVKAYNDNYFKEHPRAKNAPIAGPQHPSLNKYMLMNNHAANNLKQHWKNFIVSVLKELELNDKQINKCRITYRTYFKSNRRHDLDNISPKYILDGFVAANFIVDDSSDHIVSLTTECAIDSENPRMEFVIEIIE